MKFSTIFLGSLLLIFSAFPVFGQLHDFYRQNGDCYLLIGDGPFRGVYALNNLTGGSVELLFNRADLDSYGLVAAIKWISTSNSYIKYLFTFSGADTGWSTVTGNVPRKVVMEPSDGIYAWNVVPQYTVHRFHGPPSQGPTGKGNHPQGTLDYKFSGFDYPCKEIPAPVATMPGYYWVQAGKFYHALDWPVWSPYTYQCWTAAGNNDVNLSKRPDGTFTSACTTRMAGPDSFTNEYAKCGCASRSARGGWVHWILRENILAKYRDLTLYEFNRTTKIGPTAKTSLPQVKTGEKSTMDKRGECIDGCITQADGVDLPGRATPFLDTAYSSVVDRSYLYSREPTSTEYTLSGVTAADSLVGKADDLTAQNIGISS
ncbi:hypothetical protein HYY75_08835, partial [bacterium]|nr:hypothetical protein [bacterium]